MNKVVYDLVEFSKSGEKPLLTGVSFDEAYEQKDILDAGKKKYTFHSVRPRVEAR